MTNSDMDLNEKIDKIKGDLLDLSDENNFLNFIWDDFSLPIIDVDFYEFFLKFVMENKTFDLIPESSIEELKEDLENNESNDRIKINNLKLNIDRIEKFENEGDKSEYYSQNTFLKTPKYYINRNEELILKTPLDYSQHSKILNSINLKYAESIAHDGVANLFLALGFLEFNKYYAPLILIPVSLIKSNNIFALSYNNYAEIKVNEVLKIKLEDDKIDFPISKINEMNINSYLTNVIGAVSDKGEMKPFISLSLFDFKNIELYNDLNISNMSDELKEELEYYLSKDKSSGNNKSSSKTINEKDVDSIAEDLKYNVYDADSSQIALIEEAKLGKNIIVDTHSGTNKSQTIINLIAEILANKKTVLYVSEKMEAIKDIEYRLDDLSLNFSYLDLYGDNYNNSRLINEIIKTIDYNFEDLKYNPEYLDIKIEKTNNLRSKINNHFNFIHSPYKITGFTPYFLMGLKESNLLKIEKSALDLKIINLANLSQFTEKQYRELFSDIDEISKIYQEKIAPASKHKFRDIESLNVNDDDFNHLLEIIPNLNESIKKLIELNDELEKDNGIKKLKRLGEYNIHFDNIEILNKNPNIMGDDFHDLNNFIKSLDDFQIKIKEYGSIEELENCLTNELFESKKDLKEHMDELGKLENSIKDLNYLFAHFEDSLSVFGVKRLNSLDEIDNSIDKIRLLTENPSKVKDEKELEEFLKDMGKYQKMNSKNTPLSLLKFINDTSAKTLENSIKRIHTLISNENNIQSLQNLIIKFNNLKDEIGLNKFESINIFENSLEKCDIILEKPVLIEKGDNLAKFYADYERGYNKYSKLSYEEYYNSMNNEFNEIQNNIISEVAKSSILESKLLSIKNELNDLKLILDDLSKNYSTEKVSSLKEIDEYLDKMEVLSKADLKIREDERKEVNAYIQLIDDVKNKKAYTKYPLEKIEKIIENILQVDNALKDLNLKYSILDIDIDNHYQSFKSVHQDFLSSPIEVKSADKIVELKHKLNKFKSSKDSFLRRILSNKEEIKAELKMHYKAKNKRNLRISDEQIIKDYENFFRIVERFKHTTGTLQNHYNNVGASYTNKNYKEIDRVFQKLIIIKSLYKNTKREIPKYVPNKSFMDALDELVLIKLKLSEINNMENMDRLLFKYFPNSYERFNSDLNELYSNYNSMEEFNKLFASGFLNKAFSGYENIDREELNENIDKIKHQKSKIYYYITLINNNLNLKDSKLGLNNIFTADLNGLLEYCERLYLQIKEANDLFNESFKNYELNDISIVIDNYNKLNNFNEIKFLSNTNQFQAELERLNDDFEILSDFNLIYEDNIDLIQRYYIDIWNGNKTSLEDIANRNKICNDFTKLYNEKFFNKEVLGFLKNSPDNIDNKLSEFKKLSNQLSKKSSSFDNELIFYKNDLQTIKINDLSNQNNDILSFINSLKNYKFALSKYNVDDLVDFEDISLNSIKKTNDLSKDMINLFDDPICEKYDISFDEEKADLKKINSKSKIFDALITLRDSINSREDIINNHFYHEQDKFNLWEGPLTPLDKLNEKVNIDKEFTILLKERFFKEKVLELIESNPNSFDKFLSEIGEYYEKLTVLISNLAEFNIIKNSNNDFKNLDFNSMRNICSDVSINIKQIKNNYSKIDFKKSESLGNDSTDSSSFDVDEFSKNIKYLENVIDSEFVKSTNNKLLVLNNHKNKLNGDLTNLKELISLKDKFDGISIDQKYFNHIFDGYSTDISKLNKQVDINLKYEKLIKEGFFNEETERIFKEDSKLDKFNSLFANEKELVEKIIPDLEFVDIIYKNDKSFLNEDLFDIGGNISLLNKNKGDLKYWRTYQVFCRKYDNHAFAEFINALNNDEIDSRILVETFNYNFANNLLNEIDSEDLTIDLKSIEDYKHLENEIIKENKFRVIDNIKNNRPNIGEDMDNIQYIAQSKFNKEVNAKNKKPIKEFLKSTIDYIKLIKPVFIMNPLSVAQYLDYSKFYSYFDYIIIDDINNIKVENSISALLRAKTKIIFSNNKFSSDEGISDLLMSKFTNKSLKWYYLGDDSLIEFSNKNYYDNELIVHKPNIKYDDFGLKLNYIAAGKFNPKLKINDLEAQNIVDYAINHYKTFGFKKSLGIVAFTKEQRDLIIKVLLNKLEEYPDLVKFFNPLESFFVKDISEVYENRDIIIISLTYGFDESDNLNTNFDLTNDYVFNLALSRALEKTVIFSNFKSEDLIIKKNSSEKERSLKELLDFIEERKLYDESDVSIFVPDSNQQDLSLFTESVYEFLIDNGFNVKKSFGLKNNCIDLVVVDEKDPNRYVIAIETDGDNYYNFVSLKDREIMHVNRLEDLGWNYYHIYASDWNENREESKEKLLNKIKEAMKYEISEGAEIIIEDDIDIELDGEVSINDIEIDSDDDIVIDDDLEIDSDDVEISDESIELGEDIDILSLDESAGDEEFQIENLKILLLNN